MIRVEHDFGRLPPEYRELVARWDARLQSAMRSIAAKTEAAANRNLSGGGPPGAYPVPRRTGHLARSLGSQVRPRQAIVFNSALYARAVHDGFTAYGNPNAPTYPARPFLEDAARSVDAIGEIVAQMEKAL